MTLENKLSELKKKRDEGCVISEKTEVAFMI